MCIDVSKRTIYVFGGRILTPRNIEDLTNDMQYSGLYSYHINTNTWTQILVDCGHPSASNPEVLSIKSRVTHSMLFHHVCTYVIMYGYLILIFLFYSVIGNYIFLVDKEIRNILRILFHLMLILKKLPLLIQIILIQSVKICLNQVLLNGQLLIVNGMKFMCSL